MMCTVSSVHAVYRPGALKRASQELLDGLLADVDRWAADLPEELKFIGSRTSPHGGFLHLLLVCVEVSQVEPGCFASRPAEEGSSADRAPSPIRQARPSTSLQRDVSPDTITLVHHRQSIIARD